MSNSELGLYLRKKREEKGIPLFEVSTRSKIRMYYLENIEKGEFSRLPSVPNGRGFVRAYASIVGVNPDDAARMYDMEFANDEPHPVDVTRVFTPKEVRRGGAKLLVPVVMVFLFVVASGGLLWFMRGRTDRLLKLGGFTERVKMAATPTLRKLPFLNDVFVSAPSSNGDKGVSSKASPPRVGAPGKERAMAPPKVLPRSAGKRVASTPPRGRPPPLPLRSRKRRKFSRNR